MVHLHSSLPHDASSGWNFRSSEKLLTLRCDSQSLVTTLGDTEQIHRQWDDPLDALEWMAKQIRTQADARWVGYISYDLGRLFEALPSTATDDLKLPLFCFSLYRNDPTGGVGHLQEVSGGKPTSLVSSFSRDEFLSSVRRAIDYIRAGDIFQVNLSQRFSTALKVTPATVWENLLSQYPAAYGAFLDASDHVVISNSPELFIKVDTGRRIITRPIKGTRPNRPGMDAELRDSSKDQAELNMIVDLERNDLGRICQVGSVRVTTPRTIEMHPTVFHGVATIEGVLREEVGFVDLLRATFPGGSVTGAPKIRAMQIIEQLEPIRRGPYCGAIGYLASDGTMQFNVAIRTMMIVDEMVHIPVGGGIVADSVPADEYDETLVKARAMFHALGVDL